jgi:polar amino acid transport system substrate-binding protein
VTGTPQRPTRTGAQRRKACLALCAALASVVLGACGSASPSVSGSAKVVDVLPKGAQIVHPTPPPPTVSCNATASLQPPATMPTPGNMPSGSYMAQILARGYLKVGVDQSTFLWGYRDPTTGQLSGFDIDMLRQVAQAIFGSSDPKYIRYVIVPNADRVQAVQDGEVDVVAETMTINCEREKSVDFSTVYYLAGQKILVPLNSTITGPQDLGGKRVCATQGSTSLQNLVASGMPKNIQLWAVNNETDCLVMLQQGQVDAISTDDAILLGLAAQDPNTKVVPQTAFSSEPYGMAISKAHPDFTSFVNGVLAQVRANGTWTQIYDSTLGPYTKTAAPAPPVPSYR